MPERYQISFVSYRLTRPVAAVPFLPLDLGYGTKPPPPSYAVMPRYFFHVFENGRSIEDDAGIEIESDDQLQLEARRLLPEIAREEVPQDGDRQAFTVLVADEDGRLVYTATLTFAGLWLNL